MRFMRRAKRTRFVRLYVFGVDGSICKPGPATPWAEMPLPMIELMPLRPRALILVLGEADVFSSFCLSEQLLCLCGASCSFEFEVSFSAQIEFE